MEKIKSLVSNHNILARAQVNNNKRGDGLSLNIIVIAVIALLILVILAFIVLRGTGNFSKGTSSCSGLCIPQGGQCNAGWVAVPSSCGQDNAGTQYFCCTNVNGN